MKLVTMWVIFTFLLGILGMSCLLAKKKDSMILNKWTKFECGFNSMAPSHMPFSFQFFLIALLFLIFDVEISMLLALPLEKASLLKTLMIFGFLIILTFGLLYEWKKGKIDWSEWSSIVSLHDTTKTFPLIVAKLLMHSV